MLEQQRFGNDADPNELEKLRAMKFEGVVAKRIDSTYRGGEPRSSA